MDIARLRKILETEYGIHSFEELKTRMETSGIDIGFLTNPEGSANEKD